MRWWPSSRASSAARLRFSPRRWVALLFLPALSGCWPLQSTPSPTPTAQSSRQPADNSGSRLVGYFAAWSPGRHYQVSDIPVDSLTHVIYAFAGISDTGDCIGRYPGGDSVNLPALMALKQHHPSLRTLISVGGANGSGPFAVAAGGAAARTRLAQSCTAFMKKYGFDGIDIDWEFPSSGERDDYTALLQEFRRRLDAQARSDAHSYLLTIAAPAGPSQLANLDLGRISPLVDWINVMTYNFAVSSTPITNFNAPLFAAADDPSSAARRQTHNVDAAIQTYLAAGVPGQKLVVGVAFSGHGWSGVQDTNHGLFQSHTGVPAGTWEPGGVFDYRDLAMNYLGRFTRYWHGQAKVPWLYSAAEQVMITYDDPESLAVKADYIREKGLGGVMAWQLSADDAAHSLVLALRQHLGL